MIHSLLVICWYVVSLRGSPEGHSVKTLNPLKQHVEAHVENCLSLICCMSNSASICMKKGQAQVFHTMRSENAGKHQSQLSYVHIDVIWINWLWPTASLNARSNEISNLNHRHLPCVKHGSCSFKLLRRPVISIKNTHIFTSRFSFCNLRKSILKLCWNLSTT